MNRNSGLLILLSLVLLGACTNKNAIRPGDTLEVAFHKATQYYNRGKYPEAASAFETVLSLGRGSSIAEESQWLLAQSYFKSRDYVMAIAEFQRYHGTYPRSERRSEAEFMEAYCHYLLSPRYNLDQTDTHKAIELFQLYLSRYPTGDRAQDAATHIESLRTKLARKTYSSGDLYLRVKQYDAAAIYYGLVIDKYPETPWAERALARQAEAYLLFADNSVQARQKERYEMVLEVHRKYVQLFPNGANRSLIEDYVDRARVALSRIAA